MSKYYSHALQNVIIFIVIKGPTHTFPDVYKSPSANFYISMNQSYHHSCNVNFEPEDEANFFCKSFYGFNHRAICYEHGWYTQSGEMGNQMHSASNCFAKWRYGNDISNTYCNNRRRCKIWRGGNWNFKGLYDIVCSGNSW